MTEMPERHEDRKVAERLEAERPIPRPAFRGALRVHLRESMETRRYEPPPPRVLILACGGSGLVLLGAAAIGLAGVGPLAA